MHMDREFLKHVLTQAGLLLTPYFGKYSVVAAKENRDILTQVDLASNTYILKKLQEKYPDIPVLSEETALDDRVREAPYRFVLDPLDGTINFSCGIDEFGISLAFQKDTQTMLGLVYKPMEHVFFEGEVGKGSTYKGKAIRVRKTSDLAKAIIAVDVSREHKSLPAYLSTLHPRIQALRSYGCAVQVLGYLARGNIDAYLYDTPKIWDIAAMECIIKEAGGLVLDQNGRPWQDGAPICICTPAIREQLFACLNI